MYLQILKRVMDGGRVQAGTPQNPSIGALRQVKCTELQVYYKDSGQA